MSSEMKLAERGLALMRAGLTRRQLLRVLGVSAVGAASTGLLAACDADDGDGDDEEEEAAAAGSDDESDGTSYNSEDDETIDEIDDAEGDDGADSESAEGRDLVIAVQALPTLLDPQRHSSNIDTRITGTMFDHLIERRFQEGDPPGTGFDYGPMLAETWEWADDLTLEVELRDDVTFHNGDPMTAEDVKFSFERFLIDPIPELVGISSLVDTITEVNVIDDYSLEFVTVSADPILQNRLASYGAWIVPKGYFEEVGVEEFEQAPIGTGPYQFVSLTPDNEMVLEAFEDYFMGAPAAPRVEFRAIPELASRVAAIVSGQADIIVNVPPDQVATLEEAEDVNVHSIPLALHHIIMYNTFHPSIEDKRIRQALNLAIDRELLVETLWSGNALRTRGHQIAEYGEYFNEERPYTPFDPDRARALLDEAGYDGEEVIYFCSNDYYINEVVVGQAIVQMWEEVGVNASQQVVEALGDIPWDEMVVRTWSNPSFNADPDGGFWYWWKPEFWPRAGSGSWNEGESHWDGDERFDELGDALRRTTDHEERFEIFQEMLDIWEDEAPATVLYSPTENYGIRDDVDWQPYSYYDIDLRPHNFRFV